MVILLLSLKVLPCKRIRAPNSAVTIRSAGDQADCRQIVLANYTWHNYCVASVYYSDILLRQEYLPQRLLSEKTARSLCDLCGLYGNIGRCVPRAAARRSAAPAYAQSAPSRAYAPGAWVPHFLPLSFSLRGGR